MLTTEEQRDVKAAKLMGVSVDDIREAMENQKLEATRREKFGQITAKNEAEAIRSVVDRGPTYLAFRVVDAEGMDMWFDADDDNIRVIKALKQAQAVRPSDGSFPYVDLHLSSSNDMPASNLRVKISERVESRTDNFGKTYTAFKIYVRFGKMEWNVERRFREFEQLHDQLCADARLKPLMKPIRFPSKQLFVVHSSNPDFVQKRRRRLAEYLYAVNDLPEVCESPPLSLLVFLGMMSTSRHDMTSGKAKSSMQRRSSTSSGTAKPSIVVGDVYKGTRQVVHVSQLNKFVKFGDIILFKSNNILSSIQRKICSSEWDHTGIVVHRSKNRYLELLESTGDGVCIYPLKNRLRAYATGYAHHIGIRRLTNYSRTSEARAALSKFALQVNGKPYSLTLSKLVSTKKKDAKKDMKRRASSSAGAADGTSRKVHIRSSIAGTPDIGAKSKAKGEDQANYFCSELCAAAFRVMGVLVSDYTASHYWPSSFAEGSLIDEHLKQSLGPNGRPVASLAEVVLVDCKVNEVGRCLSVSSESSEDDVASSNELD